MFQKQLLDILNWQRVILTSVISHIDSLSNAILTIVGIVYF
jgi:hypothetical protein